MITSIELIKAKLEAEIAGKVKSIYIGDPWIIPASSFPCLVINPIRTDVDFADSGRDQHTHTIQISLIIDARQYFNATPAEMVGTRFLAETMEKENSDSTLNANTISDILRSNLNLGTNRWIQNISSINYTMRRRDEQLITLEATAELQVRKIIVR
jgi:hypothetical protein